MALSYCHTGNKEDLVMAKRLLQQLTSKVYSNSIGCIMLLLS